MPLVPDIRRPKNPNIPYFSYKDRFKKYPKPAVDGIGGESPQAYFINEQYPVELYEALFSTVLGYRKTLTVYISRAGFMSLAAIKNTTRLYERPRLPESALPKNYTRFHRAVERDVCYVLCEAEENKKIVDWLALRKQYCSSMLFSLICPFGVLRTLDIPAEFASEFYRQVGFEPETPSRITYPKTTDPIKKGHHPLWDHEWLCPPNQPMQEATAADENEEFENIERVRWIWPPPDGYTPAHLPIPAPRSRG